MRLIQLREENVLQVQNDMDDHMAKKPKRGPNSLSFLLAYLPPLTNVP